MTDKPDDKSIPITDPNRVQVAFVNQLVGSGILNGVANFTFATANWMPTSEGKFDVTLEIASRLRMDVLCLVQVRDAIDVLLAQAERPEGKAH